MPVSGRCKNGKSPSLQEAGPFWWEMSIAAAVGHVSCWQPPATSTTADADTKSPAEKAVRQLEEALNCEGSKEEKIVRALLSQLEIDYDSLTKEEFVTLIGILNKSEHMKKHISRRGKVPAPQRRKRKKR